MRHVGVMWMRGVTWAGWGAWGMCQGRRGRGLCRWGLCLGGSWAGIHLCRRSMLVVRGPPPAVHCRFWPWASSIIHGDRRRWEAIGCMEVGCLCEDECCESECGWQGCHVGKYQRWKRHMGRDSYSGGPGLSNVDVQAWAHVGWITGGVQDCG
jgi:hypothetical protein